MAFCQSCGSALEPGEAFCPRCGKRTDNSHGSQPPIVHKPVSPEPPNKLCCELAFSGTLFWLPLLACPGDKNAKYCANQGLWILIISILACWSIQILGTVNNLLSGHLVGIVASGVYSLLFIAFLFLMGYLLINCIKSAMAIHRGERPNSILFFEKRAIIR